MSAEARALKESAFSHPPGFSPLHANLLHCAGRWSSTKHQANPVTCCTFATHQA